jgi:hypothetical protein
MYGPGKSWCIFRLEQQKALWQSARMAAPAQRCVAVGVNVRMAVMER